MPHRLRFSLFEFHFESLPMQTQALAPELAGVPRLAGAPGQAGAPELVEVPRRAGVATMRKLQAMTRGLGWFLSETLAC